MEAGRKAQNKPIKTLSGLVHAGERLRLGLNGVVAFTVIG